MRVGEAVEEKKTLHSLKAQEKEARRQLIIDAAISLFSKRPISDVSVRDIAKQAEISPALIYRHFQDRDALFVEAFVKKSEDIIKGFERMMDENGQMNAEEVGVEFVSYLLDNDLFFRMMTYFMLDTNINEKSLHNFNENIRRLLGMFDEVFKDKKTESDIRLHSHAFFAALNGVLITYRQYPGRTEKQVREHMIQLAKIIGKQF